MDAADTGSRSHAVSVIAALLLIAMSLVGCAQPDDASLRFEAARIRLPVPGTDKSVGYFQVTNTTSELITLISAQATDVRSIEFHTIVRDSDMMRMRRLDSVDVAPGETVEFVSGGNHLMLFGVGELGETVTVVLRSAQGGEYPTTFTTFAPG